MHKEADVKKLFELMLKGAQFHSTGDRVECTDLSEQSDAESLRAFVQSHQDLVAKFVVDNPSPIGSKVIHEERIGDQPVYIIDDLLSESEAEALHQHVRERPYRLSELDFEGDEHPIFAAPLEAPQLVDHGFFVARMFEAVRHFFPDGQHALDRAYINLSRYGDMEYPHKDCLREDNEITGLYYAQNSWSLKFGGEALIHDKPRGLSLAIQPKPRRAIFFPGWLLHTGSVPTRACSMPRYSVAMKF